MEYDAADVEWSAAGGTVLSHAVLYEARERTWRKRLFSWPWRPWQRYEWPIAIWRNPEYLNGGWLGYLDPND